MLSPLKEEAVGAPLVPAGSGLDLPSEYQSFEDIIGLLIFGFWSESACDKPGAVCQDPRLIGGDGIMFYFHGRKDKDFCLVSDPTLHINAHFIGKKSKKGRDFTSVHSIGILFGHHQFYLEGRTVLKWQESTENMLIHLNGEFIVLPNGEGKTWKSPETGLGIKGSWLHVTEEDCFAHLELNFKFESISKTVDGVLGQTYRQNYQSRVKMATPMPVMGGAEKFASSHLFATDCSASKFGLRKEEDGDGVALRVESGSSIEGKGILCQR
ncbi:uncharacterized protein LOC131330316 [Rhododendron vialii]|uniref:uncharacterized protein LOC131330316 n=1 Tax=Rhododendron vialii TaxID=182163 RepID=UPI00265D6B01|nr:uncharacterized protein LOC131330316 [Rhododendron vialii]